MILETVATVIFVWLISFLVTTYIERKSLPPGPFPYPWVGNLRDFDPDSTYPFMRLRKKYGDIFSLRLVGNNVVLCTAALAREARIGKKDVVLGLSPDSIYPQDVMFGGNEIVFSDFGTAWAFRKKVFKIGMHVYGAGIEKAEEKGEYAVNAMIEKVKSFNGQPFSPKELVASAILIQIWQWLSSEKITFGDPTIDLILEFGELSGIQTLKSPLYRMIPFHNYLPTQFNHHIKRTEFIINKVFPPVLKSHLETYTPNVIRDLTDSFISAYKKEFAKEKNKDIGSIDDITGLMLDVAIAGSDPTSSVIAWFFVFMVVYPDIQAKIQDELDRILDSGQVPRRQEFDQMHYLQATICEVFRRCSPVMLSSLYAIRDTTIGGYHVPKGTTIIVDVPQIHADAKEWPQPNEFKPKRFLDDEGKFVGWTKFNSFIPFGIGRRECGGINFAKIMMFTFTSTLLRRFKFQSPEGVEKPSTALGPPQFVSFPRDFNVVVQDRSL